MHTEYAWALLCMQQLKNKQIGWENFVLAKFRFFCFSCILEWCLWFFCFLSKTVSFLFLMVTLLWHQNCLLKNKFPVASQSPTIVLWCINMSQSQYVCAVNSVCILHQAWFSWCKINKVNWSYGLDSFKNNSDH